MFLRKDLLEKQKYLTEKVVTPENLFTVDEACVINSSRLMYKCIAQGNAMADAEKEANLKWIAHKNVQKNEIEYSWK